MEATDDDHSFRIKQTKLSQMKLSFESLASFVRELDDTIIFENVGIENKKEEEEKSIRT